MTAFSYKAVVSDGRLVQGTIEAPRRDAAVARLLADRLTILEIAPQHRANIVWTVLTHDIGSISKKRNAARRLLRRLALLVGAGVNVEVALQLISNDNHVKDESSLGRSLLWRLRDGDSLSKAMRSEPNAFSISTAAVVKAGESGGSLAETLTKLTERLEKAEAAKRAFESALIYPAVLVATAAVAIVIILLVVIPQLEPIFSESRVPPPIVTRIAFALSGALRRDWLSLVVSGIIIGIAFPIALRFESVREAINRISLHTPVLGRTLANAEAASFSRALSAMLDGGVPLSGALKLCESAAGNLYFCRAVKETNLMVNEGQRFSSAIGSKTVVPRLLVQLAALGEATGRLGLMLGQCADILEADVERDLNHFASILTPALTFIVGGIVAAIIASVMVVVTSLGDALQ